MRALKWIGYVVGGLILLIIAGVGTVYAITSSRIAKTYPTEVEAITIPADSASIARGAHLVRAVGKCAGCHGPNLEGGPVMDEGIFARLTAPNISSGNGSPTAGYSDADWVRSIRYGVRKNGKPLLFMPAEAFTSFNDADLGAIIAYLRTVPPAETKVAPLRSVGPIGRMAYLFGGFPLVPAEMIDRSRPRSSVAAGPTAEYGRYLAETGGCTSCHTPSLAGQKMGSDVSSNITTAGPTKSWTEEDFFTAIRTGTRPDGTKISEAMPWKEMATLTDDELRAMWLYIRSVPPAESRK